MSAALVHEKAGASSVPPSGVAFEWQYTVLQLGDASNAAPNAAGFGIIVDPFVASAPQPIPTAASAWVVVPSAGFVP